MIWKKGEYKKIAFILIFINLLAVGLFAVDFRTSLKSYHELSRNEYGKGGKVEELIVSVGKSIQKESVTINIEEQEYSQEEISAIFKKCIKELDTIILGENKSLDEVCYDLNFPKQMPDYPINLSWELDNYKVLDIDGTIQSEELVDEGTLVEIKGTLSYREKQAQYITSARVIPPQTSKKEEILSELQREIKEENEKRSEKKTLQLPDKYKNQSISWKKEINKRAFIISFLGIVIAVLLVAAQRQNIAKQQLEKKRQMMIDYPEIINQLMLMLEVGMTVKNAWQKIINQYQEYNVRGKERYAFEEMKYTWREMQSGIPEGECYERFGYRCQVQAYMKLGALLSQNLRKGTKGLVILLSVEAMQAFENRKALAKKAGEEAGTKLLAPMFGMLAVVLVIVVVPAFLSIQM